MTVLVPEHQTPDYKAVYAATRIAVRVWGAVSAVHGYNTPIARPWHRLVQDWQGWLNNLNHYRGPVLSLPAPDPTDEIAAEIGLSSSCRQKLRTAGAAGLCLKTAVRKVRQLRQSGALGGVGGVYITHERNRRGDKIYHRIRLNICAGGRRFRRDLGSYRVR